MSHETLHAFLAKHCPSARKSGSQWIDHCPAHEDRRSSLTIGDGKDGRILLHCHAGCATEAILAALGLDERALFPDPTPAPTRAIVATYDYTDAAGHLLYQVVRFAPKDFRARRPDGHGGWIWNLEGVTRVCYRLHDLQGRQAILVVEGEEDVNAAWALGIPATTNPGGAGKWNAAYSAQLVQAGVQRVAVTPDNDVPGRKHGHEVAASVTLAGMQARVLVLPDLPPKGDLRDYLRTHGKDDLVALLQTAPIWTPELAKVPAEAPSAPLIDFRRTDSGSYTWAMLPPGIMFELDRLRRDHHELCGELKVRCDLTGVPKTLGGAVLTADFNLSSARARQERAKLLAQRAKTGDSVDWMAALEEFCERVFDAERRGNPAIRLDEGTSTTTPNATLRLEGLSLLLHHPVILFGDGGTAKSYLALYLAGRLAQQGERVLYADWELLPDEHRVRLHRLFGATKPQLWYLTCERPLVAEQDRLSKIIRTEGITYLIVDSVAVACDGPPEAAEVTAAYFRTLRTLAVGSLSLAHTNRSDQADRQPFGSSFWHNLARSTWFCRRVEETEDAHVLTIGLFNRKANLGPLDRATGFTFRFEPTQTLVTTHDVRDIPELASQLPTWQRMHTALSRGPMTRTAIAAELGVKENSITQVMRRHQRLFERTMDNKGVQWIQLVKG